MIFSRSPMPLIIIIGCIVSFAWTHPCSAQDATYHKDILPLLQKHCLQCHHKGGIAPQSMETYPETKPWIRSSMKTVKEHSMPPWPADPAVGKWKNNPSLTDAEIATIVKWGQAKGPEGNAAEAPPKIDFSKPWKMGQPDVVLEMGEAYPIPAQGGDIYRAFVLKGDFAEDTWLSGVEFSPSQIAVTQFMAIAVVPADVAKKADDTDAGPGFGFKAVETTDVKEAKHKVAVWSRGVHSDGMAPEGTGILIPKGSSVVLSVHYKTNGEAASDQSKVGLFKAKAAPAKELKTMFIENPKFEIPANADGFKVAGEQAIDKGIKIYGFLPKMHYLGKTMDVTVAKGGGAPEPLLKVTDHNYDLETVFQAAEPIAVPAGSKLAFSAGYSNTMDNPHRPTMPMGVVGPGAAPQGEAASLVIYYTEE